MFNVTNTMREEWDLLSSCQTLYMLPKAALEAVIRDLAEDLLALTDDIEPPVRPRYCPRLMV